MRFPARALIACAAIAGLLATRPDWPSAERIDPIQALQARTDDAPRAIAGCVACAAGCEAARLALVEPAPQAEDSDVALCKLALLVIDERRQPCASVALALVDAEGRRHDLETDSAGVVPALSLPRGECVVTPAYGGRARSIVLEGVEAHATLVLEDWHRGRSTVIAVDDRGSPLAGAEVWVSEPQAARGIGCAVGEGTARTTLRALFALRDGVETRDRGRMPALQCQADPLWMRAGVTDAEGRFELRGCSERALVQATAAGHGASRVCRAPRACESAADPVLQLRVVVPTATVAVELLAPTTAVLCGTVRLLPRSSGRWSVDGGQLVPETAARQVEVCGGSSVTLAGVVPGAYWLDFVPAHAASPCGPAVPLELHRPEEHSAALTLAEGVWVEGVVRSNGAPVPFARVEALDAGSRLRVADAAGRFVLSGLPAGRVELLAVGAGSYSYLARAAQPGEVLQVELELESVELIRGRVAGADGAPVAGVEVHAQIDGRERPGLVGLARWGELSLNRAETDAAGHYEVAIPPGASATVTVSDQLASGQRMPVERRRGVRGGETLDFILPLGSGSWSPLELELVSPRSLAEAVERVVLSSADTGLLVQQVNAEVRAGVAAVHAIAPGTYQVLASGDFDGALSGEVVVPPHGGRGPGAALRCSVALAGSRRE